MEGHIEDAEQQLEFLTEIQQSIGKSGVRGHLNDLLSYFKNQYEVSNNVAQRLIPDFFLEGIKKSAFCILYFIHIQQNWFINPLMLCLPVESSKVRNRACLHKPKPLLGSLARIYTNAHLLGEKQLPCCICRGTAFIKNKTLQEKTFSFDSKIYLRN